MIRIQLGAAAFLSAMLSLSTTAAAQIAPAVPRAEPMAAPPAPVEANVPPAVQPVSPPAYVPPAQTAVSPAAVAAQPASPPALDDLTSALGFGIGVIPNSELAGTTGAVAIKYWIDDTLAVVPLFSFAYDKPRGVAAAWHLRPEAVLLFTPWKTAFTRFEIGGGLGIQFNRPAPMITTDGSTPPTPDTSFAIELPIQAGVEHFFKRWLSLGIAARADLFAYSKDGDYHEVSFTIDSTSLLAQLFIYTD